MIVHGPTLSLRRLTAEDASPAYLSWMEKNALNQFLESRWSAFSLDSLRQYIEAMNNNSNYLFGIFRGEEGQHIGNIKIGDIHPIHRYAHVGLLIGETRWQGQGYGTQAVELAVRAARTELNLRKLVAGLYAPNIGSHRIFVKNEFREVGRFERHRFHQGDWVDEILMEKSLVDSATS